ncbi:hypothetical protein ACQJBY_003903 [Aegilops geniculata]
MMEGRKRKASQLCNEDSINPWNRKPYSPRYYELFKRRHILPVWQHKDEFAHALRHNQIVIVAGDVWSGNTTQIPQFVFEALGFGNDVVVACALPSRASTMLICQRVAEEMDVTAGQEVGYHVPFEDFTSEKTALKFLTDDMLLREATKDPLLSKYTTVVLGDAHELTLSTSVLCTVLKNALKKRPEMKLVVTSVMQEEATFQYHFTTAFNMKVPVTIYPVEIHCQSVPVHGYVDVAVDFALEIHSREPPGAILIFLSAQSEVEYACWEMRKKLDESRDPVGPVNIVPIYSALPFEMQQEIFQPPPVIWKVGAPTARKIFVSTGVAEAALTLEDIAYVIDSGLSYEKFYDAATWAEKYILTPIPIARANQRADLAGRSQYGRCYRLYTQWDFEHLPQQVYPESSRRNLGNTVLMLKKLGISNLKQGFIDVIAPTAGSLEVALTGLRFLGALDANDKLLPLGEIMSEFPLDVQMTKMIIASVKLNCSNEIISISAMLSVPSCFLRPVEAVQTADAAKRRFCHMDGDHLTLLNVYNEYMHNNQDPQWCQENFVKFEVMKSAHNIREQLAGMMTRLNLKLSSPVLDSPFCNNNIKLAMLSGYFMQVAHRERSRLYRTIKANEELRIDVFTALNRNPEWLMYHELHGSSICIVTDVTAGMVFQAARQYYDLRKFPHCQEKSSMERALLQWLTDSDPSFAGLYKTEPEEVPRLLMDAQWERLVPIQVAPLEEGPGCPSDSFRCETVPQMLCCSTGKVPQSGGQQTLSPTSGLGPDDPQS